MSFSEENIFNLNDVRLKKFKDFLLQLEDLDNLLKDGVPDYENYEEIARTHKELKKHYQTLKLPNHGNSVSKYVQSSGEINKQLLNDNLSEDNKEHVRVLDDLLEHHQKSPRDLTLYSGMSSDPRSISKNGLLSTKAYISTSLSPSVAHHFAITDGKDHHILKINLPKNSNGHYIHEHGNPDEHEFLLPRNMKLQHSPTPNTLNGPDNHKIHIWDVKPV